MDLRRRTHRLGLAALVLIAGASLLWLLTGTLPGSEDSEVSRDPVPVAQAPPRVDPAPPDSPLPVSAPAPEPPCAAERAALDTALASAKEGCTELLGDRACFPPFEHPAPFRHAMALDQTLQELFADCPQVSSRDWLIECAEYPCGVVLNREALQDDCMGSRAVAEAAKGADAVHEKYGPIWERWALFSEVDIAPADDYLWSHVHARAESRMERLGRLIQDYEQRLAGDDVAPSRLQLSALTCDEVRSTLQELEQEDAACEALAFAWSCTEARPPPFEPWLMQEHEAQAEVWLEEFEERCPTLADAPDVLLDCSRPPCMFGFTLPPGMTHPDASCLSPDAWTVAQPPSRGRPPVTVIPLWDDWTRDHPEVEARFEIEAYVRQWQLILALTESYPPLDPGPEPWQEAWSDPAP